MSGRPTELRVFTAERIHTMDPGRPAATAVAVADGSIVSVGSLESMQPWLRRMPHEIDERYAGRVMFPGFIDPHTHLRLSGTFAGLHYVGPVELASPGALPPVDSRADVLERLRLLAADAVTGPDGRPEPVVCWGYDPAAQGGHLDRDLLDQVSDAVPIWVCAYAPHIVYTNSPMLELADVDEESVNESHDRSPRAVPR